MQDQAEALKKQANAKFAEKSFDEAIELYTQAIAVDPTNAVLFSNRAFANLKLEKFGLCLADAKIAIELDPKYIKGYYRRGSALMFLNKHKEALKDFKAVARLVPNDKDAQKKFKACEQIVRRINFEAAIRSEEEVVVPKCESFDPSVITVEAAYSGPRFTAEEGVTLEFCKEAAQYFKEQKRVHRRYVADIIQQAHALFKTYPTLVDVTLSANTKKLTVCGDTHGQFYDLLNIFEINGFPSADNPYLFNGDFVDRGSFSVEVILTLLSIKVACPEALHLIRGNHETLNMNKMYGFDGEVKAKYDETILQMLRETFLWLPLCAVIENKSFVCHGGLFSRDGVTLDEIRAVERHCEPPDEGLMTEMLWSDPKNGLGRSPSPRGVGVHFGADVTADFLKTNNLDRVIRSHECKPEGFEVMHGGDCITVFSAPNYCDQMGNKGAYIVFEEDKHNIHTFTHVEHPKVAPMAYATNLPFM